MTKMKLVKALVFPIVWYGAATWMTRKAERKKVESFDMWCWKLVLSVMNGEKHEYINFFNMTVCLL